MTNINRTQLLIIVGAAVLFVLLYFAPKQTDQKPEQAMPKMAKPSGNMESFVKTALGNLAPEYKAKADEKQPTDSLVEFWNKAKRPDLAAYYFEKGAAASKNSLTWFKAGDRYYYSVRFIKDQEEIPVLYESAIRCYETGLKLEPANNEAKIMLASCYVESSQDPMKGINMLKEIEKTDSNNVTLQLNFAFFSVRSQQWDKAIRRFQKVLAIDSTYIEAYLHLADAYEQTGDKTKTIDMLEKYLVRTDDALAKEEIKKYIQQLKN